MREKEGTEGKRAIAAAVGEHRPCPCVPKAGAVPWVAPEPPNTR